MLSLDELQVLGTLGKRAAGNATCGKLWLQAYKATFDSEISWQAAPQAERVETVQLEYVRCLVQGVRQSNWVVDKK